MMSNLPPPIPLSARLDTRSKSLDAASHSFRSRHLSMLVFAGTAIILAFMLEVQGDRVAFWFLPQWQLPQSCGLRAWFGITCPGCGLTRSFIYLAHGQWTAAYHVHRVGWLIAAATVLQIPYRLICLKRGPILKPLETRLISGILIFALIFNWVLQLIFIH